MRIISNNHAVKLWENSRDSIQHALFHFAEFSRNLDGEDIHNRKWIVLSVHHAAETFVYALLKDFDEHNCAFYRKGRHYFPGIDRAVKALLHPQNNFGLAPFEKEILKFLRKLSDIRDKLMHGDLPADIDVSISAMAIVGLSKISKERCEETADDIYTQYPSIQIDVARSIKLHKLDEYIEFVESYVNEKLNGAWALQCPSCAAHAILEGECEACFEELSAVFCSNCDETNYMADHNPVDEQCFSCGNIIPVP